MWKTWRLYRRKVFAMDTSGNVDGRYLDKELTPTEITFRARNEKEAMKKAEIFWEFGGFGFGSICVSPIKENISDFL